MGGQTSFRERNYNNTDRIKNTFLLHRAVSETQNEYKINQQKLRIQTKLLKRKKEKVKMDKIQLRER